MRSNARKALPRRTGRDFDPDAALADPPGGWYMRGNLFKYHAACYLTHAPIECARDDRAAGRASIRRAVRRAVAAHRSTAAPTRCATSPHPATGLEAKFSLRFTIALALAGVDTARLATYSASERRRAAPGAAAR